MDVPHQFVCSACAGHVQEVTASAPWREGRAGGVVAQACSSNMVVSCAEACHEMYDGEGCSTRQVAAETDRQNGNGKSWRIRVTHQ